MNEEKNGLKSIPWFLSISVTTLTCIAWGNAYDWRLEEISVYQLFPLFGVWAFSLMWVHYATDFFEKIFGFQSPLLHWKITRTIVLLAILAHPGLLSFQRFRDGLGLPPGSVLQYAGESLSILIIVGIIAWFCFMAYELDRWHKNKSWFKWVGYASDLAMILILIHGLFLQGAILSGWFIYVWYFYGISLFVFLGKNYFWKNSQLS